MSETVTVQTVAVFLWSADAHDRLVDVLRFSAVIVKLAAVLPKWVLSPA
jgi:hypothetical protein